MTKLLKLSLIPILFTLCFIRCTDDSAEAKTGDVIMNFAVTYDGVPIEMYVDRMPYMEDSIFFTKFSLFLSDAQFQSPENENLDLFNIAFVNFEADEADRNTKVHISEVPVGTYESMTVGLGVDSVLNAIEPSEYSLLSPLSNVESYWPGWSSYIFSKTEGKVVTPDSLSNFSYHTGSDGAYRTKTFGNTITVKGGKTISLNFNIELKRIFKKGDSYYDLLQQPGLHNSGDKTDMNRVSDNLMNALKIQ